MKTLLPIFFLLLTSTVLFGEKIYNSNILGMKLGEIDSVYEADSDYYLIVRDEDGIEHERLFKENKLYLHRSITRQGSMLTIVTKKTGETETVIQENGIVLSEQIEVDGEPVFLTEYFYEEGRLQSASYYNDGVMLYKDIYRYTRNGRLLDVKRDYETQPDPAVSFYFTGGRLSRYAFRIGSERNYIEFDKNGIISSDTYGEGSINETREYGRLDNGGRFELITDTITGESRRLLFSREDRIVSSVVRDKEGGIIEETVWTYSGELLSELKIKNRLSLELFEYQYEEGGLLKLETYIKNGNIMKVTEYNDEDNYFEKLYRYGKPVLKITYKDGERFSTEELQE